MANRFPLEEFKAILGDRKTHIAIGKILSTEPSPDFSTLRCKVSVWPEEIENVVQMSWSECNAGTGSFQFPSADDLVIIAYADGSPENGFIIGKISSSDDKIPLRAFLGHCVHSAPSGKKMNISSDTRVNLGRGNDLIEESEPLVLGEVLKSCLDDFTTRLDTILADIIAGPIAVDSMGSSCPTHPALVLKLQATKLQLTLDVTKYLVTIATNILSQIAYTER